MILLLYGLYKKLTGIWLYFHNVIYTCIANMMSYCIVVPKSHHRESYSINGNAKDHGQIAWSLWLPGPSLTIKSCSMCMVESVVNCTWHCSYNAQENSRTLWMSLIAYCYSVPYLLTYLLTIILAYFISLLLCPLLAYNNPCLLHFSLAMSITCLQ